MWLRIPVSEDVDPPNFFPFARAKLWSTYRNLNKHSSSLSSGGSPYVVFGALHEGSNLLKREVLHVGDILQMRGEVVHA